ncbi:MULTISPECIES: hypothetical protein [Acidobacteriaceae]|uniref:hypothetical protein n=1 Tax=Acidobacteriaceae TaxID=204434 RepID=UPI00131A95FA|nr:MULTISPECIES: hypothetical protein [Acidobacteriaceae]MDW5266050.1 hypothetical protein [Edaphobacter sp.]
MKLSRIRFAFPWRTALILALVPCLPLLGFWAWLRWEVPPLQRYYLAAYWHSSEDANQPDARTQVQWLMKTGLGRKRQWLLASDVAEGSQSGLPLELSSFAVQQGWTGIERTSIESMGSSELEDTLQKYFYDGESFRRLANEPLLYGVAAWLIVAYLAIVMRGDIGYEWRQFRRAVTEPQWSSNYERDWPENRDGIVARIQSRIAHWISEQKTEFEWPSFGPAISRRFGLKKLPNPETLCESDRPTSTQVRGEVSTAPQLATPPPSHSPKPPSQRRTIFPGSSSSDAAHLQSKPWDESEWID